MNEPFIASVIAESELKPCRFIAEINDILLSTRFKNRKLLQTRLAEINCIVKVTLYNPSRTNRNDLGHFILSNTIADVHAKMRFPWLVIIFLRYNDFV